MKLFTKKNIIQKMTIVLVILMLFNFIVPNYARAESSIEAAGKVIFTPVRGFLVLIADAFMNGLQYLFVTNEKAVLTASDQVDEAEEQTGEKAGNKIFNDNSGLVKYVLGPALLASSGYFEDIPNFKYTPQTIFEGRVKSFNINFITGTTASTDTEDSKENNNSSNPNNNNSNQNNTNTSVDYTQQDWYKAYMNAVDKVREAAIDCYDDNGDVENDNKLTAALQILKGLGCSITGANTLDKVKKISPPNNQNVIKNTVRGLSAKNTNGQDVYGIFGFSKDGQTEISKCAVEIIDASNLMGLLGVYHQDVGDDNTTSGEALDYDALAPVNALHDMIATWYKIMRNIALVFLLSILVYVGIRIMLSSTAADTAKYKKMLMDWVVALCILFVLHYIMAFTGTIIDVVTSAFANGTNNANWVDDIFGNVRLTLQTDSLSNQFFYTILYLVLVIYTVIFTVYYLKRVVYAAFLTLIAPLVALTYPLDKMGDGRSQAFDMWLKEYIANAIIQPVHLLIYTVLISSVFTLAETNPLYAIVVMGAMIPSERFIREMFSLNSKKGPGPAGSFAGGAIAASAFNKLLGKPPLPPHHKNHNESIANKESNEKSKIRINDDNTSDLAKLVAGEKNKSIEDKNFDNGDFKNPRDNKPVTAKEEKADDSSAFSEPRQQYNDADGMKELASPTEDTINNELQEENPRQQYNDVGGMEELVSPTEETINNELQEENPRQQYNDADGMEELVSPTDDTVSNELQEKNPRQLYNDVDGREELTNPTEDKINNNLKVNESQKETKKGQEFNNNAKSKINGVHISAGNHQDSPGVKDKKEGKKELRRQKRAAKKAANKKFYAAKRKQQLKQLGGAVGKGIARGALKTAGGALGVAAGATFGLAGAIASGDASNLWKFGAAGTLAGAKGGSALGNSIYDLGEGAISNALNDSIQRNKMWKEDLYNHSEEYRKQVKAKESKKFVKSAETKAAIKERFGHMSNFKMKDAIDTFSEYRQAGINDLDTMLNIYGLEQGIDANGHKFAEPGQVSHERAILAGKMAEQFDVGNASARKSTKDSLELHLANGFREESYDEKTGEYTLSESDSVKQGKDEAKDVMRLVDMAQGIESSKAGLADVRENLKKKRENAKAREDYMETQAWKDEYKNSKNGDKNAIIKNMHAKTKNGEVTIKDTAVVTGHAGKVTVNGKEVRIDNLDSKTKRVKPTNQDNSTE